MLQIRKKIKRRRRKNPKRTSIHSTMTADEKRALADLVGSLAAQGDRVAAGLEERLRTVLEEGEELPDVRFLLKLLERLIERSSRDLDQVDIDGFKKAMGLSALRFECRKVKREVHAATVRIRKALVELVGSKQCRFQFGLALRTPRGAADLAIEARSLVSRLANPGLELAKSLLPGLEADPEGWVAELSPGVGRLEGLLRQIEVRRIAVSDAVIARRKALDASAETRRLVLGTCEGLFALAGQKELARRLRPRRRRRPAKRRRKPLRSAALTLFERLRRIARRVRSAAIAALARASRVLSPPSRALPTLPDPSPPS